MPWLTVFGNVMLAVDSAFGKLPKAERVAIAEDYIAMVGLAHARDRRPAELSGGYNLGFMFLPAYRIWVIVIALVVCFGTWFAIERTRLGAYLRAATENPSLVQAFGINVPVLLTLTYAFCVGLAGFAGALAAPIYQVSPGMGANFIIIVFAVVVIGGMGSIVGTIVTGLTLGVIEGLTKVFFPTASAITVFIIMILVLMVRPTGLFGRER